jgi:hypothetical protein
MKNTKRFFAVLCLFFALMLTTRATEGHMCCPASAAAADNYYSLNNEFRCSTRRRGNRSGLGDEPCIRGGAIFRRGRIAVVVILCTHLVCCLD